MFFHLTVFFWTVIYVIGLELIAYRPIAPSWKWYFSSIVLLLAISFLASQRLTRRKSDVALPGALSLSVPILLSLIDSPAKIHLFIVLTGVMYYFSLLGLYRLRTAPQDQTALAFLNAAIMAVVFFFYSGVYGFYLNFNFPTWGLMLLFFTGTALVCYQTFISAERKQRERARLYSVLVGFVMGELSWMMSFWPFGYLTTGAFALIFFFLLWDIALDAFREQLSLKKAAWRIVFFFGLMLVLLMSTPWRILV